MKNARLFGTCGFLFVVVFASGCGQASKTPPAPAVEKARENSAFKVEIANQSGAVLAPEDNFALAGIEQTLIARITPAIEGAEFEWTVGAPALRTYEHDIQKADKHRPIPLTAKDRAEQQLSFFWTTPQDQAEISVRVRKGADEATAKATFAIRLPRDPNRDIYSFADNDRLRNPNGLSATYASSLSHRDWHLGLPMSNGDLPVFGLMHDPIEKFIFGDFGYRDDPARLFELDYNGGALLGWHSAFLYSHRAWRNTFHVPDLDTATPPGALAIPEYFKRVPDAKSAAQSKLYNYVRMGEYQNRDQLGRDAVHVWHNRGHTGISQAAPEPRMDDQAVSPPARDDLFFRWHTIVEEVGLAFKPDQAAVTTVFPEDGKTVADASAIYLAFDKKVSANAPAVNAVQLAAGNLTVNGKPATSVADVGGDALPFTMFRLTGFPAPTEGPVKVELKGTPGYKGTSWTFTVKKGLKPDSAVPEEFQRAAQNSFKEARARQCKEDLEGVAALLKAADADDHWIGYLFRIYPQTADDGVPILVKLLDHPSSHIKAHALQTLQYGYAAQAQTAIPKLIALLDDKADRPWWLREWSARALGEIGAGKPEVIAALIASIQNKKLTDTVNRGSIEALGRMGPLAGDALPVLRKYVASTDPEVQLAAYRSIGRIVKSDAPSPADLKALAFVDWKRPDGGYAVFQAIQQAGPKAAYTVPALLETFRRDPPVCVKGTIIETLGKIQAGDAAAVQLVLDALAARWGTAGDPPAEKFLSDIARAAIEELSPSDPAAVLVLAKGLGHADPLVRLQAALALRKYGPKGELAVPALVEALKKADDKTIPHEIGAYLDALRAIGPNARAAGDTLVNLLSERSQLYRNREQFYAHYLQAWLMITLADTEVPAGAKPSILDFLNNSDKTTGHSYAAAARAAGALGPQMPEAIPGLLRSLKPDFPDVVLSFNYFGIALGAEDGSCRREALRALAKMGPKAQEAVPLIAQLTKEKPEPTSVVPTWDEDARKALSAIRPKE